MGRIRRSRACTDGAIISGFHSQAPERVSQVTRSTPSIVNSLLDCRNDVHGLKQRGRVNAADLDVGRRS
jgi:hypothetical protein